MPPAFRKVRQQPAPPSLHLRSKIQNSCISALLSRREGIFDNAFVLTHPCSLVAACRLKEQWGNEVENVRLNENIQIGTRQLRVD